MSNPISGSCGDPYLSTVDSSAKFNVSLITNMTLDCVYYVRLFTATSADIAIQKSHNLPNSAYELSIYGGFSTAMHSALFQSSDFDQ